MKPIQTAITGAENQGDLTLPIHALTQFYYAFNNRDIKTMALNWDNSEDIAMDNPLGGIKRGWGEVKGVYERIFNGSARVYVEFYDYTIHAAKEIFYVVGRERGNLQIGDTKIDLAIRTSRIFRLANAKWRQVHHHGSIDNPELLRRYQDAVR